MGKTKQGNTNVRNHQYIQKSCNYGPLPIDQRKLSKFYAVPRQDATKFGT